MTKKSDTPAIRFKGFTDTWEQRKLGEIGSVSMCRRIFKEQTSENGEIPFYKIGTFGGEADAFISRELFEEYKAKYQYPKKGDILISASGSIGRTVVFTGKNEYFQDSNIVWLNHDKHLDNSFLKCFYSIVKWAGIEGSTIKRLYNDNILNTAITLPSVEEQQKIGAYFENLDNLITLHQRKYDKLTNVKKSMLEKMFPKNGSNVPEIRFKGFTEAWEQRKLGELGTITTGSTPSTSIPDYYSDDGIVWVTPTDICENITFESARKLSDLGQQVGRVVPKNTILVTCIASIGKNTMLGNTGSFNQQINGLTPNENECDPYFLLTESALWSAKMKSSAAAGTMQIVNRTEFSELKTWLPSLIEQQAISDFFRQLDNLITLHQRELEKLKNIKKSCLENMFV